MQLSPSGSLPGELWLLWGQPAPSPQLREITELCLGFLTPHHDLLTFTRQHTGTIVKLTLFVFCLRYHRSSLPDV